MKTVTSNLDLHISPMNDKMMKTGICLIVLLFLAATLVFGSCAASRVTTVTFFPVQTESPDIIMDLLLQGKLELNEAGYLRVGDALILWWHGYSYEIVDNDIWILNEDGQRVARVGDDVRLHGGFIPEYVVEQKIGQPLPEDCEGPYFLMGPIDTNHS
jgi:hypothetical protein